MRDCDHMPGAGKDVVCPLCKDLAKHGKPVTKHALTVLNQQPAPKPKARICPVCEEKAVELVTRAGQLMCQPCAENADYEDATRADDSDQESINE